MRAFDPEVVNALWAAIEPLLPVSHEAIRSDVIGHEVRPCLLRGDAGSPRHRVLVGGRRAPLGAVVSDTTARQRRDEWIGAGVFDAVASEAVAGYDKIVGLDLSRCRRRRVLAQSPCWWGGNRQEPSRSGQARLEVVRRHRCARHPHWLDRRTSQPQRRPPARPHPRRGRGTWPALRNRTLWLDRGYDGAPTRHFEPTRDRRRQGHQVRKAGNGRSRPKIPWVCAGRWNGPTRGCRTTARSGATPTAASSSTCSTRP